MPGMVLGSTGTPLAPWHAAHGCALASISSAACTGGMPTMISRIAQTKRVRMSRSLPRHIVAGCRSFHQENLMRARLMLTLAATASAMVFPPLVQTALAESPTVLTGTVSSEVEGKMEGVVVTAQAPKSIVRVSVTTDAQGRYSFPQSHLKPGQYALSIRAVGYDIESPVAATVGDADAATADLKLKKTKNLAGQLSNAEWMMRIRGTEDQKAELLNCVGCHTLERVVRSTHGADEWTHVVRRMMGYGAVSQPIKPQRMLDANRAGKPEQYRKLAEYLATINLSATDHWQWELKTLARPKGRDTRAIVTQYDMVRPTTEPHDVLVDKEGHVWYTDFGNMFIGKFDPKTLELVEYPIKKFKPKAPEGLLSIEFDREGKIWFDTMYQGSMGRLDPKTGKIAYYPVPNEWNDDTVQLNFSGLRHDVDGKIWTKTVGTQHIFRADLKTGKWERFHPADFLPKETAPARASVYQVISDSQNNLWMAEFQAGHIGKIDAKTTEIKWWPVPTKNARARRMNIDDQDRITVTEYRGNKVARFDTRTQQFTEYDLPPRTYPYRANFDKNGEIWASTRSEE